MQKDIDHTHAIFNSPSYQKDIVPFNLMEAIKYSAKLIVSDEKSWIVCSMLFPTVPAWIWTSDNISHAELSELGNYMKHDYPKENNIYFVAKSDISSFLSDLFNDKNMINKQRLGMESFECPKLILPKNKSVLIEKPHKSDLKSLLLLCNNYAIDCFGKPLSEEDCEKEAEDFIRNPRAFMIREDEIIVAMAKSSRETKKHIAINGVYTLPKYRCRGYAAALVAYISELILDCGKIPLLYTDLSNPSSNKAYINVGFVPRGKVDEIKLEWIQKTKVRFL